ncbi:Tetracycline resistance protein [Diplonema papillatum]|nr:Tetracycline resistance protein [Diplonema papillatum]|eukprot:gene15912-24326_t
MQLPAFVVDAARGFLGAEDNAGLLQLATVHANIVLYAFAYWLTQPVLPFLSESLGADLVAFGYLQTVFSIMQLVGGPVFGRVCDAWGPRAGLVLSQAAAALSYALLGLAWNVPLLFLSQLPTLGMHSMHAAQAAVARLSSNDARAASLGRLSLSYGMGMILGSLIGGYVGKTAGYHHAAFAAALVSLAALPLNYACLRPLQMVAPAQVEPGRPTPAKSEGLGPAAMMRLLEKKPVRDLMVVQLLVGLGLSVYRSSFSQALRHHFDLGSEQIGVLMSLGAIVSAVTNVFAIPPASRMLPENQLLTISLVAISLCMLTYTQASTLPLLIAVNVPFGVASTFAYTIFSSLMTKSVSASDSGTSIGFGHATRTLCGVVAPTLAGYLYQNLGFGSLGSFAAAASLAGFAYVVLFSSFAGTAREKKD